MVYCAAFDCNANSSENIVACSWFNPTYGANFVFKKGKLQADEAQPALLASRNERRWQPWVILVLKSL